MNSALNSDRIKQKAYELGFHLVGIAAAESPPENVRQLQNWLAQGYHADMDWMKNPKRQDVKACFPEAKSVIAVALNYYTPDEQPQEDDFAKISRYAWGRDYHRVLDKKLKAFALWLQSQGEGIRAKYYADTGPVQDKAWAQQAGLGWIAKNGNVITRKYGSWVFLGEILTNLDLEIDRPHTEHCGTCTRCLQACPTDAIVRPFVVDANRCIAYHTIENRSDTLPPDIAKNLQGWVAGCDICQEVCPWNQRFATETDVEEFRPYPENRAPRLSELVTLSEEDWDRRFRASALRRIKPWMWRRNAKANLPNWSGEKDSS
ncbi:tRNA epoxyqueuosine(34) reductase QueG [Baaleninema sp.]|uniref:tRNA epoxyqueuosine(34) reductase QueG n=1 Tax=Baaleninema sp. TaxID=3101197 RepID=UPI003D0874D0